VAQVRDTGSSRRRAEKHGWNARGRSLKTPAYTATVENAPE
jgi:hypothetical protein